MAITLVQSRVFGAQSGTSHNVAYNSNVTQGNLLIASCADCGASGVTQSISDTLGNVWTPFSTTAGDLYFWFCINKASGANTVTFTETSTPNYCEIIVAEFSGIGTLDQQAHGTTSPAITTLQNGELIIGSGYGTAGVPSAGTGWTLLGSISSGYSAGWEYQIQPAKGSITPTWSSNAPNTGAITNSFTLASAGGGGFGSLGLGLGLGPQGKYNQGEI